MLTLRGLQRIRPLGHRFSKLMGDFLVARATFNDTAIARIAIGTQGTVRIVGGIATQTG